MRGSSSFPSVVVRGAGLEMRTRCAVVLLGRLARRAGRNKGLRSCSSTPASSKGPTPVTTSSGAVDATHAEAAEAQDAVHVASRAARRERRAAAVAAAGGAGEQAVASKASGGGALVLKLLGGGLVAGVGYVLYQAKATGGDADIWEATDRYLRESPVGPAYKGFYDMVASPFVNPSREKLLPDWHNMPNIPPDTPCPPTLVLDLEDTLIHATWDPKFGWRYAKRPGVDKFLQDLAKYYEIVLFSPNASGIVEPVTWTLDKQGLIMHRLYRESTTYHRGRHVKDLSRLNRDLRRVVIVDDDANAFCFQPDNGIRIKPFSDPKNKNDRSLDKLRKFLLALVMEGVEDIPAVLRQFRGMDAEQIGDRYEKLLREAKARELEAQQRGLGGVLRSQKAFKNLANPFAVSTSALPDGQQRGPALSSKDIVGGVGKFDEKAEAQVTAGPVKKGKLWDKYTSYLKEQEEEQRRKLEVWHAAQNRREEERKKQMAQAGLS